MLLDPSQRLTPQTESAPVGTKVGETLETVGKYGGLAMTGIDKVGGGIAGKVGGKKDDELRKHLPKDDDPSSPVPSFLDPLGVGEAYTTGAKADKMRKAGQRDEVDKNLPTSDATKASAGIGNVTSILSSLFSAVQSALGMAQQIEASWTTNDPYEGLKAAKSGSAMLTGLVPGTRYRWTATATTAAGSTVLTRTFDTPGAPTVRPLAATGVTRTGATVPLRVHPHGLDTTVRVEWGAGWGSRTADLVLPAATWERAGTVDLTGLAPGTTYRYRVVASNAAGTTVGPEQVLTTAG